MKLPAIAMVAPFGGGIALGGIPAFGRFVTSPHGTGLVLLGATLLIATGLALLAFRRPHLACFAALLAWASLGAAAIGIASQPPAEADALVRIERGEIALDSPLRWHGTLRDEPTRLPWGLSYDIDLSSVEYRGATIALQGGLRLNFAPAAEGPAPEVHAGDRVAAIAQAHLPRVFRDEGAFDRRAYLRNQGIELVATLRSPGLLERVSSGPLTAGAVLSRARVHLRAELDGLYANSPGSAPVLRAMLLGDRGFIDRAASVDFQKTGVYHVLVIAGLHVAALATFLCWFVRRLRLPVGWAAASTLLLLFMYVCLVEQRPPVLRAALTAGIVACAFFFYRRLELFNSAALAALVLLVAAPRMLFDSSFQLSFAAIGCIAGLAAPWLEHHVQPYARALRGWRDVTRDAAFAPRQAQFRIDLRAAIHWTSGKLPRPAAGAAEYLAAGAASLSLRCWELFVLSFVLQFAMLPMIAGQFHRVSLAGPLANLFAVPLVGLIVPLGFFALVCGLISLPLGKFLALPVGWLTELLIHSVHLAAQPANWSYRIPGPPAWLMGQFLMAAIALAVFLRVAPPRSRIAVSVTGVIAVCAVGAIAVYPFAPQWSRGRLELTVLDVGQGDSLFVVTPTGKTLLIDGGGAFLGYPGHEEHTGIDPGEEAVSPYLWSRGFQRLDVVALTHAHQDHLGGLKAVLENFRVGQLWLGRDETSVALTQLEREATSRGTAIVHEWQGRTFDWDGVRGEFVWPERDDESSPTGPKNNDSLAVRLTYKSRSLLLPGDAEKQAEYRILADEPAASLRSDVLKIGHHGSKNSTTPEFLAAVAPSIAIISSGAGNPYGHPSLEVIERLHQAHVRVLRTDRSGAIHVQTDGSQLQVSCFLDKVYRDWNARKSGCFQDDSEVQESVQGPAPQDQQNREQ